MSEKMHFTRMDQGTDEDFKILKRVHESTLKQLPDRLMGMLNDLSGDQAYNLNRKDHSLQTATRALRDGANEEREKYAKRARTFGGYEYDFYDYAGASSAGYSPTAITRA